jgi:hypothetical protein
VAAAERIKLVFREKGEGYEKWRVLGGKTAFRKGWILFHGRKSAKRAFIVRTSIFTLILILSYPLPKLQKPSG